MPSIEAASIVGIGLLQQISIVDRICFHSVIVGMTWHQLCKLVIVGMTWHKYRDDASIRDDVALLNQAMGIDIQRSCLLFDMMLHCHALSKKVSVATGLPSFLVDCSCYFLLLVRHCREIVCFRRCVSLYCLYFFGAHASNAFVVAPTV